jgi:hypothetical protein
VGSVREEKIGANTAQTNLRGGAARVEAQGTTTATALPTTTVTTTQLQAAAGKEIGAPVPESDKAVSPAIT